MRPLLVMQLLALSMTRVSQLEIIHRMLRHHINIWQYNE